jgi:ankyrin repeat protein
MLLEKGADAAVTDEKGKTCLSIAMDHTHDAAAELLVQPTIGAGVDIDAQDKEGKTVLMRACADGLTNTAAKLMKLNANLGIKDKHDSTALELTKDTVTFKCLREGGAQIPDITEEVLVSVCLCAS